MAARQELVDTHRLFQQTCMSQHAAWFWERSKRHGKGGLVTTSAMLFFFGVAFLVGAGYYSQSTATITDKAIVYSALAEGILLIFVSMVGAITVRGRTRCVFIVFIVLVCCLIVIELALIGTALVGLSKMSNVVGVQSSLNITDATSITLSDFTLSMYTACCTGCTVAVCGKELPSTPYCNQTTTPPHCQYVPACAAGVAQDGRCFIQTDGNGFVPPMDATGDCGWLKTAGFGGTNRPLVGDIGGALGSESCGGGSGQYFQRAVLLWAQAQYAWLAACVGVIIFLQFLQLWFGFAFYRYEAENSGDGAKRNQLRPWAHEST